MLKGPNRFFRNRGDGTFEDATEAIGLTQKVFNTQAVCLVDLNSDGARRGLQQRRPGVAVLLGNPKRTAKKVADAAMTRAVDHEVHWKCTRNERS